MASTATFVTFEQACSNVADSNCYDDGEFPADIATIGKLASGDNVVAGPGGEIVWKRAGEFLPNHKLFEGVGPNDIIQGTLGDCYLLSALSVLAEKPERIRKLFINTTDEANEKGVYGVRLVTDGIPREVVLDDKFPVFSGSNQPCFAKHQGAELWVMLLEKAYAKCYGTYEAISGGDPGDALSDLTGLPHVRYDLPGTDASLFEKLKEYDEKHFVLCANAPEDPNRDLHQEVGIVEGHAYGMLAVKQLSTGDKVVKLRNPWGKVEWSGAWSDGSDKWNDQLRAEAGSTVAEDGEFFMSWEDFNQYFNSVVVLYYHDGWSTTYHQATFEAGQTVGAVDVEVSQDGPGMFVLFQRRDNPAPIHVRFCVQRKDTKEPVGGSLQAFTSAGTISSPEVNLTAGTYRVRLEAYGEDAAKLPHPFVLGVYAAHPVTVSPANDPNYTEFTLPSFLQQFGTCGACNTAMGEASVGALGKKFHPSCWKCAQCGGALNGPFFPKNDKPYCEPCTKQNADKCGGCGEGLVGGYITALGKMFHPPCFVCGKCKGSLAGNFFVVANEQRCANCCH